MLLIALRWRNWLSFEKGIARRLVIIVLASAIMAAALMLCLQLETQLVATGTTLITRLLTLIVLIPLGVGVYLLSLQVFGVVRIGELVAAALRRP